MEEMLAEQLVARHKHGVSDLSTIRQRSASDQIPEGTFLELEWIIEKP